MQLYRPALLPAPSSVGVDPVLLAPTLKAKPLLRGIPDVVATLAALPAAWLLLRAARPGVAWLGALIYGICMVLLFAISATYHAFMWPPRVRGILRRFDHAMVYMLIAGSYTPLCLAGLGPTMGLRLLALVWSVAALGVAKSFLWPAAPRSLNTLLYIGLGWLVVIALPAAQGALGSLGIGLLLGGGIVYTLGALIYWQRWPNPSPRLFGYHEVFHLFVMAAGGCHYATMWRLLT